MITVGMIKKALENIPDDVVIEFKNGYEISSSTFINVAYRDLSRDVLKIDLCNFANLLSDICEFHKYVLHKKLYLSSLIHIIKTNGKSSQYLKNFQDTNWYGNMLNIDDNIKNMIIYKIFDNYKYFKNEMITFFDNDETYYSLAERFKKVLYYKE